ncbi:MAG: transcription termination/antitermination protein NusG, partial [Solobacterium sp.]|nr:transcription termination/antitermination protein NusG [Solobacterium sp.]
VVVDFGVGDTVRILTGPFSGIEGRISEMNDQTQVASVLTMLFGRETPTDIPYNDLQKVTE